MGDNISSKVSSNQNSNIRKKQLIVFTDLDGTLLDHDTYSFAAANDTLIKLEHLNIPVIPNTSKTYEELIELTKALQLTTPFIIENGAAVYIPKNYFLQQPDNTVIEGDYWVRHFSLPKAHWLTLLNKIKPEFEGLFEHFSAMMPERICEVTGLTLEGAKRAANRGFSEPVLWQGSDEERRNFIEALIEHKAEPLQGGRFIHVSGKCNKGIALMWLMSEFIKQDNEQVTGAINTEKSNEFISVALGDSHNDIAMLEQADIAVRIASSVQALPKLARKNAVYDSTGFGPEGWSECMELILTRYL